MTGGVRERMSEKSVGRYYEIENRETRDLDCHQLELSERERIVLQNTPSNKM